MDREWTRTELAGAVATVAWIVSCLGLYIVSDTATLFSFDAALFVALGMFASAFVFGTIFGALDRAGAKVMSRLGLGRAAAVAAGLVLAALESVVVLAAAVGAFTLVYGSP